MRVSDETWDLVNQRRPTEGTVATADRKGRCGAACLGSIQFSDRETTTMLVGDNRALISGAFRPDGKMATIESLFGRGSRPGQPAATPDSGG